MEFLSVVYLVYMFIAIYFLLFYILVYLHNRKNLFDYARTDKKYTISVLVPVFNEEKTIENTINAIFEVDYSIEELIVLNDGSTDNTRKIVEKLKKKYPKLKLINKKNSGKADSLNKGIELAKGELVVVVDADSYPAKDSFGRLVGYFDDEKTGAATCVFVPRNKNKFLEKLQDTEYRVIAFTRKLLGYVGAIWVTPGPLAMYRKDVLKKIGGFDKNNLTEDIEITWNLAKHGYERRMCLSTHATTSVPVNLKAWYKQRRRWNIGGLQCISKYKGEFFEKGMLGMFILPFFTIQLFLGLIGLSIFVYLIFRRALADLLFATYSIQIGTPILTRNSLFITPSFLNYLGVIIFITGFIFTLVVLGIVKTESLLKKQNLFNLIFYLIIYLAVYPVILVSAVYNFMTKNYKWR